MQHTPLAIDGLNGWEGQQGGAFQVRSYRKSYRIENIGYDQIISARIVKDIYIRRDRTKNTTVSFRKFTVEWRYTIENYGTSVPETAPSCQSTNG